MRKWNLKDKSLVILFTIQNAKPAPCPSRSLCSLQEPCICMYQSVRACSIRTCDLYYLCTVGDVINTRNNRVKMAWSCGRASCSCLLQKSSRSSSEIRSKASWIVFFRVNIEIDPLLVPTWVWRPPLAANWLDDHDGRPVALLLPEKETRLLSEAFEARRGARHWLRDGIMVLSEASDIIMNRVECFKSRVVMRFQFGKFLFYEATHNQSIER